MFSHLCHLRNISSFLTLFHFSNLFHPFFLKIKYFKFFIIYYYNIYIELNKETIEFTYIASLEDINNSYQKHIIRIYVFLRNTNRSVSSASQRDI